jgi:hypothetical protein
MEELVEQLADEPAPQRNPGWFQKGDRRINREGRPKGAKAGPTEASAPVDRAPCADRLKLLVLDAGDVQWRLSHEKAPWVVNLPRDFEIVSSRLDAARGEVVFVIRSQSFPRVAKGASIPKHRPEFNGLRWRRW